MDEDELFSGGDFNATGDGLILMDDGASRIGRLLTLAKEAQRKMDAAFAGAVFALTFRDNPWLAEVSLELNAEAENGDEGVPYRSINLSVGDCTCVPGVDLPEEVFPEGFDVNAAQLEVQAILEVSEVELYDAFMDQWSYDTVSLTLKRSAIESLLSAESISGKEAFALLCPEEAGRLLAAASQPG